MDRNVATRLTLAAALIAGCGRTAIEVPESTDDGAAGRDVGGNAPDAAVVGGTRRPDGAAAKDPRPTDGGARGPADALPPWRDAATAQALVLLPRTAASVPLGKVAQWNAYFARGNNVFDDVTAAAEWTVDDTVIATVGTGAEAGRVAALRPGTTAVRATYRDVHASSQVRVVDASISRIDLAPAEATLALGAIQVFSATAHFSDGSRANVTEQALWRTGDEKVAQASNTPAMRGIVRGGAMGKTTVFASFAGVEARAGVAVQAPPRLTTLTLGPPNPSASLGETVTLTATGTFSDGTMRDVTAASSWSSSTPMIAQVTFGRVRCVAAGTATVTAATMGASASVLVRCGNDSLAAVKLTPGDSTQSAGTKLQYFVTAYFSDGTSRDVSAQATFSTSDPAVATVDTSPAARGVVTAVRPGVATIGGTFASITATATLTVVPRP